VVQFLVHKVQQKIIGFLINGCGKETYKDIMSANTKQIKSLYPTLYSSRHYMVMLETWWCDFH